MESASAMPGTHQALRRRHFPLSAVYTTSPGPGEAGSYSSHLQLWILVAEGQVSAPIRGGVSQKAWFQPSLAQCHTPCRLSPWESSLPGGGGLPLPSPILPLASACC